MPTKYIIQGVLAALIIALISYMWVSHNNKVFEEGRQQESKDLQKSTDDFKKKEHDNVTKNNAVIDSKPDADINSMFDSIPATHSDSSDLSGGLGGDTDDSGGQGEDQEDESGTQEGVIEESPEQDQLLEDVQGKVICPPVWMDSLQMFVPLPCYNAQKGEPND